FAESLEISNVLKSSIIGLGTPLDYLGKSRKAPERHRKPGVNEPTRKYAHKKSKANKETAHLPVTNSSPMEWVGIGVFIIAFLVICLVIILFCSGPSQSKWVASAG